MRGPLKATGTYDKLMSDVLTAPSQSALEEVGKSARIIRGLATFGEVALGSLALTSALSFGVQTLHPSGDNAAGMGRVAALTAGTAYVFSLGRREVGLVCGVVDERMKNLEG